MQDHTYNGVPTSQIPTETIKDLLINGFKINNSDGRSEAEAIECVRQRLEIELLIRNLGLR